VRRILWIRHLTQDRGVNLAGVRILFELEERLGVRILEALSDEWTAGDCDDAAAPSLRDSTGPDPEALTSAPPAPRPRSAP
jgi:hypothetical protein